MNMQRLSLLFAFITTFMWLNAQEIKIKSFEVLSSDLTARTQPRMDVNGIECALVRVVIPAVKGMSFSGWVIGDVAYTPGEYLVYVPEGTKKIAFKHENYIPGTITFPEPAQAKTVYRVVLELPNIDKVYVTESSAMLAEGGRQYGLRKYLEAKDFYTKALESKDVTSDLIPSLKTNIATCDSCIMYENYLKGALLRMKEIREQGGAIDQEVVAKYASAAIEFLNVLNNYNPSEYYSKNITTLETFVENIPLVMKFTIVKWKVDRVNAKEAGPFDDVEMWAYYGSDTVSESEYSNDKKFLSLVKKMNEKMQVINVSDSQGVIEMELERKSLPQGLFFRPVGNVKSQIVYKDMRDIMSLSKGEYNKRQFRLKMYIKN